MRHFQQESNRSVWSGGFQEMALLPSIDPLPPMAPFRMSKDELKVAPHTGLPDWSQTFPRSYQTMIEHSYDQAERKYIERFCYTDFTIKTQVMRPSGGRAHTTQALPKFSLLSDRRNRKLQCITFKDRRDRRHISQNAQDRKAHPAPPCSARHEEEPGHGDDQHRSPHVARIGHRHASGRGDNPRQGHHDADHVQTRLDRNLERKLTLASEGEYQRRKVFCCVADQADQVGLPGPVERRQPATPSSARRACRRP